MITPATLGKVDQSDMSQVTTPINSNFNESFVQTPTGKGDHRETFIDDSGNPTYHKPGIKVPNGIDINKLDIHQKDGCCIIF